MTLVYESDLTDLRASQGAGLSKQEGDLPNPLVVMKFASDLLRYRFDEQKMSVTVARQTNRQSIKIGNSRPDLVLLRRSLNGGD